MKPTQILILISLFTLIAFGSGCIRDFEEESNYNIRDMDISADHIGTAFVDLNVTTYIEKYDGNTAKNTSLLLKAYSRDSGLLESQKETGLGEFKKGDTRAVSQTLSLPKTGGYKFVAHYFRTISQKAMGKSKSIISIACLQMCKISGLRFREWTLKLEK